MGGALALEKLISTYHLSQEEAARRITKLDLFEAGLSGREDSAARRQALQRLGLPERLSANGLLQALNALYGREEFLALELWKEEE